MSPLKKMTRFYLSEKGKGNTQLTLRGYRVYFHIALFFKLNTSLELKCSSDESN